MLPNMPRSKLRLYTIFLVAGVFLAGAAPYAARAQSGDALAHAERTCLDHGIGPNSVTFDTCTERAASAYDQGAPGLAVEDAHRVAEAHRLHVLRPRPQTLGYHQCVARQADRAPSTTNRALRY